MPEVALEEPASGDDEVAAKTLSPGLVVKVAYAAAIGLTVATFVSSWLGTSGEPAEVGEDYATFHGAASLVADGDGVSIYDPDLLGARVAEETGYSGITYDPYGHPPFFPLFFLPLTVVPFPVAYLIFVVGGAAALVATMRRVGLQHWGVALGIALLSLPGYWTVQLGQMGLWVAALLLGSFLLLRSKHDFGAGVLIGLLLFKPSYAVGIGLWWLIRGRRYRTALAGAASSAGVLVAAGFLVPGGWSTYRTFLSGAGAGLVTEIASSGYSIYEMFLELFPGTGIATVLWLVSTAAVMVLFVRALRSLGDRLEPSFALAVIVGLLVAPRTGWYDWVLLVVPGVLLWQAYPELRAKIVLAGAWLLPAAAYSWYLANGLDRGAGVFLQIAPLVLAGVTWWWLGLSIAAAEDSPKLATAPTG